jgi:hypothetical protein
MEESPWIVGIMALEVSPFLTCVLFPPAPSDLSQPAQTTCHYQRLFMQLSVQTCIYGEWSENWEVCGSTPEGRNSLRAGKQYQSMGLPVAART